MIETPGVFIMVVVIAGSVASRNYPGDPLLMLTVSPGATQLQGNYSGMFYLYLPGSKNLNQLS